MPRAVRGRLVASVQHRGGYQHQRLVGIYRWDWGFSTSQDCNGDVALIACFASSWTPRHGAVLARGSGRFPAMERDRFAHGERATGHAPSTDTGVVVCIRGSLPEPARVQ
jgi:hypothetical protein